MTKIQLTNEHKNVSTKNLEYSLYDEVYDQYIEDLKKYKSIINSIQNSDKRRIAADHLFQTLLSNWMKVLSLDEKTIKNHIANLGSKVESSKAQKEKIEYLQDVLGDVDNFPNNWIVPDVFQLGGLYIFAGMPKTGKSLFTYNLMYSVLSGTHFLNRPAQKVKILHYQLEESMFLRKKRLLFSGFGGKLKLIEDCQNGKDYISIRKFSIVNDLDKLEEMIMNEGVGLVIIDTFRACLSDSNLCEIEEAAGAAVGRLQKVAMFTGACIILIHHMKKDSTSGNLVRDISGHSSLTSNSDGMVGLYREDNSDIIKLVSLPRDGVALNLQYTIENTDEGFRKFNISKENSWFNTPLCVSVLRFLWKNQNVKFTTNEIKNSLRGDVAKLNNVISYLSDSYYVETTFDNNTLKYSLPSTSKWMLENLKEDDSINKKIDDMNKLLSCKTYSELLETSKEWKADYKMSVYTLLESHEKDFLKTLKENSQTKTTVPYEKDF